LFLQQVAHSRGGAAPAIRGSNIRMLDPALDAEIDRSSELSSMEERRHTLGQLVTRVTKENLVVPLYMDEDVYALRSPLVWQPRTDSYVLAAEVGISTR